MPPLDPSRHLPVTPAAAAVALRPSAAARMAELAGLFVLLPLLVRWRVVAAPRLVVLALVTAGCVLLLWRDPSFDRARLLSLGELRGSLRGILLRAAAAAAAILALALLLRPEPVLSPGAAGLPAWLAGLAIYPFLSAWPQEVIYRVFFFHRYGPLFPAPGRLVAASGLAFALLHAVYPNPVAPLLSLPAGLLLAATYRRTGTMGPVWLEHTLYGLLLFTLGLGGYFYDGRP